MKHKERQKKVQIGHLNHALLFQKFVLLFFHPLFSQSCDLENYSFIEKTLKAQTTTPNDLKNYSAHIILFV